jgi:hypothetical protein
MTCCRFAPFLVSCTFATLDKLDPCLLSKHFLQCQQVVRASFPISLQSLSRL